MNQGRHHPKSSFAVLDLAEQSEEQLIDRGLKGDARALDALFARNTRALYQTALRVLGNPEDAEEALQEGCFPRIAICQGSSAVRSSRPG